MTADSRQEEAPRPGEDGQQDQGTRAGEDNRQDEDLRADFQAFRAEISESGRVPDFGAVMARVRAEATAATRPEAAARSGPSGDAPASGPTGASRQSTSVPAGREHPRLGWWIPVTVAAAAVVGLLLVDAPVDAEADFERLVADYSSGAATWRSPTASLMDIPGVDLGTVPSIGGLLGDTARPESHAPEGRDS